MTVKEYLEAMVKYIIDNDDRAIYLCKLVLVPLGEDTSYDREYKNFLYLVPRNVITIAREAKSLIIKYKYIAIEYGSTIGAVNYGSSAVWWYYNNKDAREVNAQKIEFLQHLISLL